MPYVTVGQENSGEIQLEYEDHGSNDPAVVIHGYLHGDADRILPIAASGARTAKMIPGARLAVIPDGPHAIGWTHAEEVNAELVAFLGKGAAKRAAQSV
jgi:hypothetical protein